MDSISRESLRKIWMAFWSLLPPPPLLQPIRGFGNFFVQRQPMIQKDFPLLSSEDKNQLQKNMRVLPTERGYVPRKPLTATLALRLSLLWKGKFSTYHPGPCPKGYSGVPGRTLFSDYKRVLLGSKRRPWKQGE